MRKYIPALDGLRGLAVLLVLVGHSPLGRYLPGGWSGVDLFFVLSGFLITGILLDSRSGPRYFLNFYGRRILRIWPLYFAFLFFLYGFAQQRFEVFRFDTTQYHWSYYFFYVQNLLTTGLGPKALGITWSLAVEEQFYMLWPLLIYFLSNRKLSVLLILLVVLPPVLRFGLLEAGISKLYLYRFTLTRADSLALGALMALYVRSKSFDELKFKLYCKRAAWICLSVGVAIAGLKWDENTDAGFALVHTFFTFGFAGLLGQTVFAERGLLYKFMTNSVLSYFGKISYGLYLYHLMVMMAGQAWLLPLLGKLGGAPTLIINFVKWAIITFLDVLVSTVSWYFFESQVLRLKSYFENRSEKKYELSKGVSLG